MRSMYERMLEKIEQGYSFNINLKDRTMRIGKDFPILKGKYRGRLTDEQSEFIPRLEELYHEYECSVPDSKERAGHYFEARRFDKLSKGELLNGKRREIARFKLEFHLLSALLNGLKWNEEWGTWFWCSTKEKGLVLLREWF